jgi:sodium transport system permease protein
MLRKIYLKEMKDSLRDRRTLLLSVFLPMLLMTGLTLFYEKLLSDNTGDTYNLAVHSSLGSEEKSLFNKTKNLKIKEFANPEQAVKDGDAQAYLEMDNEFLNKIKNGETASAAVFGDSFSQGSSFVMTAVESSLTALEKQVVSERLQTEGIDVNVIKPLDFKVKEINKSDEDATAVNLLASFLPMMVAMAIALGSTPSATDLYAGEKDRKTMEALLITPVKRIHVLIAKWMTTATIGALAGIVSVIAAVLEIIFFTETLKKAFKFDSGVIEIIIIALVISVLYALFISAFQMVASIAAKTVKEAQNYIAPISMLAVFPTFLLSGVGLNELNTTHFLIPIVNMFALFKELLFGVVNYQNILLTSSSLLLSIIILFVVSRIMFIKDRWVLPN